MRDVLVERKKKPRCTTRNGSGFSDAASYKSGVVHPLKMDEGGYDLELTSASW